MNPPRVSAAELTSSSDPLSDDACVGLLHYQEEDTLVDFKESFDPQKDKAWIDLAVDCVAFANTDGGYIVFGVADKTWKLIGLDDNSAAALADTKKVVEKINRNLTPTITRVRTRMIEHADKRFVVAFCPASQDCTHIFESNLDWAPAPGKSLTAVSKGAIYIRRAASNQLMTSADFELLIERRLKRVRDKILEGLVRVVQAPRDHEVVTIVQSHDSTGAATVTIGDAPETMDLKGKPLRLARGSTMEMIKVLEALTNTDERIPVPESILLDTYAERESIDPDEPTLKWLAFHSLLSASPAFWWLAKMKPADARKVLRHAFDRATSRRGYIVRYSGFFGKTIYDELREKLKSTRREEAPPLREKRLLLGVDPSRDRTKDSRKATELAKSLGKNRDQTGIHELERLDCSLYAPFD